MSDPTCRKYKELCEEYEPLIDELIALAPPPDRTIFDISEYPHYENVISNWYAFFFDPDAEHSLDDLFLKSLIEIINEDKNKFDMEGCHVEREFLTDERGFIDLVLYEQSEEEEGFDSAIIIENKIYAPVKNKLDDYYNSVKVVEPGQKIGIVLSLHSIKDEVFPDEFINITHERLLKVIKRNLGQYVASAKLKYIHTLQDFISNLEQMTRPKKMHANIRYYFDNAAKIEELVTLRNQAINYSKKITKNLEAAVKDNNKYIWEKPSDGVFEFGYQLKSEDDWIEFYIENIPKICTRKKFLLSVWLIGAEVVEHWRRVDDREKIRRNEYQLDFDKDKDIKEEESEEFEFLAKKEYEIPDIEKFGDTVFQIIEDDWSKFLKEVEKILN